METCTLNTKRGDNLKVNLHNIEEGGVMVFRKDKKFKEKEYSTYSVCFGGYDRNHNKTKKYMRVYFDRGVSVPNQTVIYIKRSFLGFDDVDWFLHISEFDILETGMDRVINGGSKPRDLENEMKFL